MSCSCCERKKFRTEDEYKKLVNRLNRIEGQIHGIKKMLEGNVYCIDILTQTAAINAAINSFSKELIYEHLKTCVAQDIINGKYESVDELVTALQKFMR